MAITATAIDIPTAEGVLNAHLYAPAIAPEAAPAVLVLMDAPGVRPALHGMAARLAAAGYRALLPNLYWRRLREVGFDRAAFSQDGNPERERIFNLARGYGHDQFRADLPAMLDALGVTAARPGAAVGYCMSGRWVFGAAAAYPDRFKAVASVYGTGLHTDAPDSPHRTAGSIKGEVYFACAENDSYVPLAQIDALRRYLAGTALNHRIEIYPGTQHGFVFADRGHYHRAGAERHWERVFALLERNLKSGAG